MIDVFLAHALTTRVRFPTVSNTVLVSFSIYSLWNFLITNFVHPTNFLHLSANPHFHAF